jgi:hypothetical protein
VKAPFESQGTRRIGFYNYPSFFQNDGCEFYEGHFISFLLFEIAFERCFWFSSNSQPAKSEMAMETLEKQISKAAESAMFLKDL